MTDRLQPAGTGTGDRGVDRGVDVVFRTIIEQSPASTHVFAPDGTTLLVNHAGERLWGVTLDQPGGYNILQDEQLRAQGAMPFIERAFAGEAVALPPLRYAPERTRPGSGPLPPRRIAGIAAWAYPIRDAAGRVVQVVLLGQDITERMQAEEQLREREEEYRGIFEATNDALVITDLQGYCVEANPAACDLYGYAYAEMIGVHAMQVTHPAYHDLARTFVATIQAGGAITAQSVAVRKDGTLVPIETRARRFTYRGAPHILAVVRDVTEQVQARELLERRVEERTRELAALLEVASLLASTLDLRALLGHILDGLSAVIENSGAAIHVVEGAWLEMIAHRFPPDDPPALEEVCRPASTSHFWQHALRHGQPVVIDDLLDDSPEAASYRAVLGQRLEASLSYVRSYFAAPMVLKDRVIGALVTSHPQPGYFTPPRRALVMALATQAAVAIENARLYERARASAAFAERQRLARELHDSVSQALYSIALGARTARTLLEQEPARAAAPLDFTLEQAEAALAEMRALIVALRPEALEQEGLVAVLARQAAAVQARQQLTVEVQLCAEPAVALPAKEALFRIAQEALHNVVKHAGAQRITLALRTTAQEVVLCIQGDGRGFDPTGAYPGHLGLQSMRERITEVGGALHIESAPGEGSLVRATVPLRRGPELSDGVCAEAAP